MAVGYSDLEVYHGKDSSAPEATYEEKIHAGTTVYGQHADQFQQERPPPPPQQPRRICGLRPKYFWLMICGITVVIVAAAVGGAVGGIQAAKSSSSSSSPPASDKQDASTSSMSSGAPHTPAETSKPASSDKETPSTTLGPTLSTSTETNPTQTIYRDCPSSNDTIYNALGSSKWQFRKVCNRSFKQPPANVVNDKASSLNDCIDLCVAYNVKNKSEIASGDSNPCNSVCWRNSLKDPDWPGHCFGSTTFNSSEGFQYNSETICDSGAWINQDFI